MARPIAPLSFVLCPVSSLPSRFHLCHRRRSALYAISLVVVQYCVSLFVLVCYAIGVLIV